MVAERYWLMRFAARYDDHVWAEREATPANVAAWTARVESLLSSLLP